MKRFFNWLLGFLDLHDDSAALLAADRLMATMETLNNLLQGEKR